MVMNNVSGHENAETYSIQGAEVNPILTSPAVELVETMYSEGTPEFVADQGLFYPAATEYGYYCTGFETPVEWEDHQKIFGADGPEIQYAGAQTECLPYVYYAPSYAYAQSPYNPYNPYIPGAMIGVDGPYAGEQQYYTVPPYQDPVSSSGYIPVVVQPEAFQNGSADPLLDTSIARNSRPDGKSLKHGISSSSAAFAWNPPRPASNQTNSLNRISEGPKANVGPVKHGGVSSGSILTQASSHVLQGRSASGPMHPIDNISNSKVRSHQNQLKVTLPVSNDFSNFGSSAYGRTSVDKLRSKFHAGRTLSDLNGNVELLGEQNRGPRINKLKNQPAVKAYTTKLRDSNGLGNIIMYKQGLEMLKMFKNHPLKTSILDDFVYYENRQKIMQEEKARLMFKTFQSPLFVPALNPAHELNGLVQQSLNKDDDMTDLNSSKKTEANKYEKIMNQNYHNSWKKTETNKDEKIMDQNEFNSLKNTGTSATKQLSSDSNVTISSRDKDSGQDTVDADDDNRPVLKIDINPTQVESKLSPNAANKSADIVTVGSMPVKVNRIAGSSGYLTVGTIPLDPKSLKLDKGVAFGKQGSQC
ncbi:hypothetical protein POTOM_031479 [Populus tomentosa]|uniref:YTH domain-containing family protein n=1 Tax=Populus tomentosa TaxID=118781 RepID=A0A8X7Z7T0_POPTO|nr:hypothetical protein POTOM_031479 [Populus tomentosa]